MNKVCLYIVLFLFVWKGNAQQLPQFQYQQSHNYLQINSYNGNTTENAYTVKFTANNPFNLPNWKLSVKLAQPITTGAYTFPANKISLQPTTTSGNPNPLPTISTIGMPLNVVLQEGGQEVFLVPQSNVPLTNNTYWYDFHLHFRLVVEGGSYLSQFPTYTNFYANLIFTAYDQNNNIIGAVTPPVLNLHINNLSGTPPDPIPQFSITIGGNAVNGLLELKTKADYVQGASVTYTNGLTVNANTDYQIKAKSLQGSFTSNTGNTLPLNTIQLVLIPSSGNSGAVFPIWLSSGSQAIASGSSTQGTPVHYDIKYSSKPNDVNLVTAKMEQYTTMLQYEITPQ